jgi:hypothetical protein
MITFDALAPLTYAELHDLKVMIDERFRDMQQQGVVELKARFIEQANALGLTLDEVAGITRPRRGGKRRQLSADDVEATAADIDVQS